MKNHIYLGYISIHHLVPRQRMRDYYGTTFHMPKNKIRLWRLRHDAWHVLFRNKTINEIIRYLGNRVNKIYAYKTITWEILFGDKNNNQARKLLERMRAIIRKKYANLELDPKLRSKAQKISHQKMNKVYGKIYLDQRFNPHKKLVS